MDNLLIGLGLILFIVGFIMLFISFVKKTKKKTAILLILIGFVVWIIGGAFVDTESMQEIPSTEDEVQSETLVTDNIQNANQVDKVTEDSEEVPLTSTLFSDSFDSFYAEINSMTTANIDSYVNSGLNKPITWSGKVIDVYSDYAYIECIDSLSTDSAIGTFCNVYASTDTLQSLKKDQNVMFTGIFAGASARSYTGCSWIVKNAVITTVAN